MSEVYEAADEFIESMSILWESDQQLSEALSELETQQD